MKQLNLVETKSELVDHILKQKVSIKNKNIVLKDHFIEEGQIDYDALKQATDAYIRDFNQETQTKLRAYTQDKEHPNILSADYIKSIQKETKKSLFARYPKITATALLLSIGTAAGLSYAGMLFAPMIISALPILSFMGPIGVGVIAGILAVAALAALTVGVTKLIHKFSTHDLPATPALEKAEEINSNDIEVERQAAEQEVTAAYNELVKQVEVEKARLAQAEQEKQAAIEAEKAQQLKVTSEVRSYQTKAQEHVDTLFSSAREKYSFMSDSEALTKPVKGKTLAAEYESYKHRFSFGEPEDLTSFHSQSPSISDSDNELETPRTARAVVTN